MDSKKLSSENINDVAEKIKAIVGEANVKINEEKCCICAAVASTEDVAAVSRVANSFGVRISACGGVRLDMSKMNKVEVDAKNYAVKVKAGATWKEIMDAAAAENLMVPSHPFDVDETVGKWIAANTVGIGTYKYGPSKDNVLNVELVLFDGTVIETGYNDIGAYMSGYNFNQFVSGSEGTFGVVVSATLKLVPAGVKKTVAYEFAGKLSTAAPAVQAVMHSAGLVPYCFCYSNKNGKNVITISYQGDEKFVDLDIADTDEIMAANGGSKIEVPQCPCDNKDGKGVIIPAVNWAAFVDAVQFEVSGMFADPYTAYFHICEKCADNLIEVATSMGGRTTCSAFCKDRIDSIRDENTAAYMKELKSYLRSCDVSEKAKSGDKLARKMDDETMIEFENILGKDNVNTNPEETLLYCHDLAPLPKMAGLAFKNIPDVVLRPSKTEQLSAIMKIAYKKGIPVTPRGNSTWGLGGSQPTDAGIVIDMSSKMNKVTVDPDTMTVTAQAGATWKEVFDECQEAGFVIGSTPSSFPAATVGAWLATNGMGIGSYKYGGAKDGVLNIEAVLPDGTVINTGYKNIGDYVSGYNLNQLFAGSEGTLCLFASVTMRMHPAGIIKPIAYEFENYLGDANAAIQAIVAHPSLRPYHISWSDSNHFANQRRAHVHAPNVKNIILITLQGDEKHVALEEAAADEIFAANGGKKVEDPSVGPHEWEERCYEFRARKVGVGEIPAEVITPTNVWGAFIDECYKGFDTMKMELGGVTGEVVDRNTSLFMPYYFKDDESLLGMTAFAFNFYLGDRAVEYGGRTTGFGIFFAWNLDNVHDANTVSFMRSFKTFQDPHDVMNPGHVVCGMTRFGVNMSHGLMTLGSALMQMVKKIMPPNTTFADNIERFKENRTDEAKVEDRKHVLGRGYE